MTVQISTGYYWVFLLTFMPMLFLLCNGTSEVIWPDTVTTLPLDVTVLLWKHALSGSKSWRQVWGCFGERYPYQLRETFKEIRRLHSSAGYYHHRMCHLELCSNLSNRRRIPKDNLITEDCKIKEFQFLVMSASNWMN